MGSSRTECFRLGGRRFSDRFNWKSGSLNLSSDLLFRLDWRQFLRDLPDYSHIRFWQNLRQRLQYPGLQQSPGKVKVYSAVAHRDLELRHQRPWGCFRSPTSGRIRTAAAKPKPRTA
nr:hypothetical protein Iba_chr11cCG13450 [Ipomoea batatas]